MNPIKGIVAVCSNYGVGKTTFCLECGYEPKDIVWINDDSKAVGFESDFKQYVDLIALGDGRRILEFHQQAIDLIDSLPKSKVLVWDTWTRLQSSFAVYVKNNESEFRNKSEYSAMGKIKNAELYQDAYKYEGQILARLRQKFDLIFLTFHLKQLYQNNVAVPDKYIPGSDKAIAQYSDFRLWLTPNPSSQVPVGLVLKNISKKEIVSGKGIKTTQVLPLRLERCNWESILNYWDSPIGDRIPNENEKPSEFELSLIEGTLTPEQKRMYEVSIAYAERIEKESETEEQLLIMAEIRTKAKELNGPLPIILIKLKQEYPDININLEQVKEWRNE